MRRLYAIVDDANRIVGDAPFDATSDDEAVREVESTHGPLPNGLRVIRASEPMLSQYEARSCD